MQPINIPFQTNALALGSAFTLKDMHTTIEPKAPLTRDNQIVLRQHGCCWHVTASVRAEGHCARHAYSHSASVGSR